MAFTRKRRTSRKSGFRRKRRVTWFPNLGAVWDDGAEQYHDTSISDSGGNVFNTRGQGPQITIYSVIPDFTLFPDVTTNHSLRDDIEGQTWALERIVGRAHLEVETNAQDDQSDHNAFWASLQVACGFFIAKCDDSDQTLPTGTINDYDPLDFRNTQNPWIWRKSWILANPQSFDVGAPACSTAQVQPDGGYIDSKVRRYIPREHRLWFATAAMGWRGGQNEVVGGETQPFLMLNLDVRVLGAMRRARNTSSF